MYPIKTEKSKTALILDFLCIGYGYGYGISAGVRYGSNPAVARLSLFVCICILIYNREYKNINI